MGKSVLIDNPKKTHKYNDHYCITDDYFSSTVRLKEGFPLPSVGKFSLINTQLQVQKVRQHSSQVFTPPLMTPHNMGLVT